MKNKYWHIDPIDYLLFALAIMGILLVILSHKTKNDVDNMIATTDTIYITNSITDWQYDTVYFSHFDTVQLPVVCTVNDTIIKSDSIYVQIPINKTVYDTAIADTSHTTRIHAVIQGFAVSLDTLSVNTEIIQQQPKKQPWYGNIVPAVGVGFGTGGQIGLFVGIGYKL